MTCIYSHYSFLFFEVLAFKLVNECFMGWWVLTLQPSIAVSHGVIESRTNSRVMQFFVRCCTFTLQSSNTVSRGAIAESLVSCWKLMRQPSNASLY